MLKMFKLLLRICARKNQYVTHYNKYCLHTKTEESEMLTLSVSHLKQLLKEQCSNVVEGYTCIITDCPICTNAKKKSKLYVNKTTGI